jgi:transketolase
MSDGELQEGQTWEAIQASVYHKIDLTAVVDVNGQQCDGKMQSVCDIGSIVSKLKAFGASVREVLDGHNVQAIDAALAHTQQSGLTFVLCHTDPCHGFPLLRERAPKLHYVRFRNAAEKQKWEFVLATMEKLPATQQKVNAEKHKQKAPLSPQQPAPKALAATTHLEQHHFTDDIQTVTRPHREHLLSWMKDHPKAIVLTADLTSSCEADLVRDELPEQYLSMGMAEQNMMSFAGGLAQEGFRCVAVSLPTANLTISHLTFTFFPILKAFYSHIWSIHHTPPL